MMGNLVLDTRRLVAWAVAAALLLMLLSFLLGPVVARHRAYDAEIARDRQVLERLSRLEASRERIDEAAKRYHDEDFASMVYAQATPPAQIALDVQKRVTEMLESSGAEVKTFAAFNVTDDDFQGSGVRVTFTGSMESVAKALHGIEAGRPLLVIEEMDIKPLMQGRFRGRDQTAVAQSAQVQLAVVAYTPLAREARK